jgi:hypothetical protein
MSEIHSVRERKMAVGNTILSLGLIECELCYCTWVINIIANDSTNPLRPHRYVFINSK